METNNKTCTRCEETKEITEFYGSERSHCKVCERKAARVRMQRYGATFKGRSMRALQDSRRTAAKYDVEDSLTLDDVMYTFAISGGECVYCRTVTQDYHLEHIVPLSRGGSNSIENITTSCASCNIAKRDEAVLMWFVRDNPENTEGIASVILELSKRKGVSIPEIIEELKRQSIDYMNIRTLEDWRRSK